MMQSVDVTYKNNLDKGRHGWIRLTPAYSIQLVESILKNLEDLHSQYVLDPFSGTGTTGLVCGQNGVPCDLFEINPFLAWISRVKTRQYTQTQLDATRKTVPRVIGKARDDIGNTPWIPNIHEITRWWTPSVLKALAQVYSCMHALTLEEDQSVSDLLKVAFCKLLIAWSSAAFNHQSMSFKKEKARRLNESQAKREILATFETIAQSIINDASENVRAEINVSVHNSKEMPPETEKKYSCVITSPPYTNRISYIREVRPYMYWLGFIDNARQAANLDWNATGGTWGVATSRLSSWIPKGFFREDQDFLRMIKQIRIKSPLLANYVHRYFEDMYSHFSSLPTVLKDGARVYYVVGNSKFYDTIVPTEEIYAKLLEKQRFHKIEITRLRKRTSKKELYEYCVSGKLERHFS